ncbi:hypothetical protein L596_013165 [Steinernema carpocapsae]|uniref:BTB domain-containing protein n=1 Tax=Steinernema carpocapsae TaxID=34508 RepID=A0A4U5P002_STECR|nr:hypothetical protein L596_013165 [Steinernema carpocapsae]
MTTNGVISLYKWKGPVNIDKFNWGINGWQRITCKPKTESRTTLWNCLAMGTYGAIRGWPKERLVYHVWNASFGNNCTEFHSHYDDKKREQAKKAVDKNGVSNDELHLEVVQSFYTDLADPHNQLIEDSEDAVNLKIEGEEIWVSKKMLSAHSHYFGALFKDNFKDGVEGFYELKEITLEEFLQFLGIIHGHEMPINGVHVERLLYFGDFYQAKVVQNRCGNFLRTVSIEEVPLATMIRLASRYKLHSTVMEIINKASVEELKLLSSTFGFSCVANSLILEKLRLFEP